MEGCKAEYAHAIHRFSIHDIGWSNRQYDRFDVLRTNFQCLHAFYRVIVCAIWYRLCRLPNWQGGRHVLLSAYRYHLSRVVSIQRR